MIPLIQLKQDVQFNHEFTQVIDVMKGISLSRFYSLQRELTTFENLTNAVEKLLSAIDPKYIKHPFIQNANDSTSVVLVTSNEGFLGGLNNKIIHAGVVEAGPDAKFTVVGERGVTALSAITSSFDAFPGIEEGNRFGLAMSVRDHVIDQVLEGVCGNLIVVYAKPVSLAVQTVTIERLLPCVSWLPKDRRIRDSRQPIWESHPADVLQYLTEKWIGQRMFDIFGMSRISEYAARSMHLEGSYQELLRIGKKLKLQYLKARHEVIDKSMREIFSAQLLYKRLMEEELLLDDERVVEENKAQDNE